MPHRAEIAIGQHGREARPQYRKPQIFLNVRLAAMPEVHPQPLAAGYGQSMP